MHHNGLYLNAMYNVDSKFKVLSPNIRNSLEARNAPQIPVVYKRQNL